MKKVQIDYELFRKLIFYHLGSDDQYEEEIRNGLEEKLDALVRHELYTKYKTAPSEEEQEKARQEYLDKRGVSASYRWCCLFGEYKTGAWHAPVSYQTRRIAVGCSRYSTG